MLAGSPTVAPRPRRRPAGQRLMLDGAWRLKGFLGEDWLRTRAFEGAPDGPGWLEGTVPGSVLADLRAAGEIPDLYADRNTLLVEWVAQRSWAYRRTFRAPEDFERAEVVFEGVDFEAEFYLDGERLGTHRSMFRPACFDVTARLRPGADHELAVVLLPAPADVPQIGRTSQVRIHRSRMGNGWDFCPRVVHQGIWRDAYLRYGRSTWLDSVQVSARPAPGGAKVSVTALVSSTRDGECSVTFGVEGKRETLAHHARPGSTTVGARLDLPNARLWWPNGEGEQPLYELEVALEDAGGGESLVEPFGVRTVRLVANEGAPGDALPYTFEVNGRRVYARGWNWVPADVLLGVADRRVERLVELARRANVNLLRVWGGGLIESETFYDACDRAGIMVWQEFIQSSSGLENVPSGDREFADLLRAEAAAIVPARRNHPSLVAWCGGNELTAPDGAPARGDEPALVALREVVRELDPDRSWLPSSPSGPRFFNDLGAIREIPDRLHDVHGPWNHAGLDGHLELYNSGTSLFHSEFGVEGMTNLETLAQVVSEPLEPVSAANPAWRHRGEWWINDQLLRSSFPGAGRLLELARGSQLLQAEGLRCAIEANRRRWPRNSGSIPWQLNEPYPEGFCTSAVDWTGRPKPAYHAVAAAYRPLLVSARFDRWAWPRRSRFEAEIWLSSGLPVALAGEVRAAIHDLSGRCLESWTAETVASPERSRSVLRVAFELGRLPGDVFLLDLAFAGGGHTSGNRYVFTAGGDLGPLLRLPATVLGCRPEAAAEGARVTVTNLGEAAAMFVELRQVGREDVFFDSSYFCLLPGESRVVAVDFLAPGGRELRAFAWNAAEVRFPA